MNKKRIIIIAIIIILVIIIGLWISGIIPKQIAIISATHYLKTNFPEKQYEYVNIEWSSSFGGYAISFKDEKDKKVGFIMPYKYLPIEPGQGTFALEESYRIEYKGITDISDVYGHSITEGYKDIRSLPETYSMEQAKKDNCFIIGLTSYNENLYSEFMSKYNKKENAFIRVVQTTIEGDICIVDVLYEARNNKVHIVQDNTRDQYSSPNDMTIKYKTYEKTGVWNYNNLQYWVAYNGKLPDSINAEYSINSDDLYIIAIIK